MVKQHTHNWQMKFTEWEWSTKVPEALKPYSPGGFNMRRYWACVRGRKIKHTMRAESGYYQGEKYMTHLDEHVFLAASGVQYAVKSG